MKPKKYIINCIICKEDFFSNRKNQVCCSEDCSYQHLIELSKLRYKNKIQPFILKKNHKITCKLCNKEVITSSHNRLFCSKNCCITYHKTKANPLNHLFKLRFQIFQRDNFRCQYCGRNPIDDKCKLHIDHIIPKSKGGTDDIDNLTTSCEICNLGKYDALIELKQEMKKIEQK